MSGGLNYLPTLVLREAGGAEGGRLGAGAVDGRGGLIDGGPGGGDAAVGGDAGSVRDAEGREARRGVGGEVDGGKGGVEEAGGGEGVDGGGGVVAVGHAAGNGVRLRPPKEGERAATSAAKTSSST
eukprot:4626843-Prymnesium_polylepis.1